MEPKRRIRNSTPYLRTKIRSSHPSNENVLSSILKPLQHNCNSYNILQDVDNLVSKLSAQDSPLKDSYSILDKLKKLKPEERVNDMPLSKALMIENIIIQQQTKSLSKYVLKDTFDFGIKNYYNKIAESVKTKLILRGIKSSENSVLIEQKRRSKYRKYEMLKHYKLSTNMPKVKSVSREKMVSQFDPSCKMGNKLNINYRKHNHQLQAKHRRGVSNQRFSYVNGYFNI